MKEPFEVQDQVSQPTVRVKRKPADPWTICPVRTVHDLPGFAPGQARVEENQYGSRVDRRVSSSGFFRVERVNGRWWLVDPDGYLGLERGIVSVRPGERGSQTSRTALHASFGTPTAWAERTVQLLRAHGFTGTGAWSAIELLRRTEPKIAYTCIWNFMSSYGRRRGGLSQQAGHMGYPNDCIFVFDPGFERFCAEHARALVETADDPFLLGHFSDNELPLPEKLLDNYLALDPADPGHQAAKEWVVDRLGFFRPADLTDHDRDSFRGYVVERYLRIVGDAIRKVDPHHMFMGPRFHGSEKRSQATFAAAGRHLDVIAVNHYWEWWPDLQRLRTWERWSGRPIIITEWYAKGMDSGYANQSGAGWIVETQQDRGLFYQTFSLGLLESRVCIGWQWFKYMDNDPKDTTTDPSNRDSNKGIVTIHFVPYEPLLRGMAELNANVYAVCDHFDQ